MDTRGVGSTVGAGRLVDFGPWAWWPHWRRWCCWSDADGLVAQHEFLLPAPEDDVLAHLDAPVDARAVVIPGPEGVDARVLWTGLPCQTAPSVEVTRDQERVVVAVARGPEVLGEADTCPDTEDFFAVDLVFVGDDGIEQVEAHVR
jgi:hypothetical protein